MATKSPPDGYHTVTPYVTVQGAADFLKFVEKIFGGKQVDRVDRPDGLIMHATVRIGDSLIMVSDANEQMPAMPASLYVYVDDVDGTYRQAIEAGAKSDMEPVDMFWGDRFANFTDRWNINWSVGKQIEEVAPDEIKRRAQAMFQQGADQAPC